MGNRPKKRGDRRLRGSDRDLEAETRRDGDAEWRTDFDDEGQALLVTGSVAEGTRRSYFVPASMKKLDPQLGYLLRELHDIGGLLADLREQQDARVADLRECGVSWSLIGWATGMTGEGARTRWMDAEPSEWLKDQ